MPAPSLPAGDGDVQTTVTIGTGGGALTFTRVERAGASWNAIDELTIRLDGGYDELSFTIEGVGPMPPHAQGTPVSLAVAIPGISGGAPLTKFVGNIDEVGHAQTAAGWAITFAASGLSRRADWVTVTGRDGTGNAAYNRQPSDPYYIPSLAGMTVGAILGDVLTVPANAGSLSAYGVGNYVTLSPPTLPAATLADLAALTVVPPKPVLLSGTSLFDELLQLVRKWHPQFAFWVQPDGTIRCKSIFGLPAKALVVPGEAAGQNPDPVGWPHLDRSTDGCFTQVVISGIDVQAAVLRISAASLVEGWSPTDQSTWTIYDFTSPKDSADRGTITSLTASSATIASASGSTHWSANFWNAANRGGFITLIDLAAAGITFSDNRQITSTGALTAGGSCVVGWDASNPITSFSYTTYEIVGLAAPAALVGRLFLVKDGSGATGASTFIGARLWPRFPRPMPWSNNGQAVLTTVPVGVVCWTDALGGQLEFPFTFQVDPIRGGIVATEPVVKATATLATLASGWPSTTALGLYTDVKIMVPYNRGNLAAQAPATGYSGTAYAVDGIERTLLLHQDEWQYGGDTANMIALAGEYLKIYQDATIGGQIKYRGYPTAFDPLTIGYSLALSIAGISSPWDGADLPVRSVTLRWPQGGGTQHEIVFNISNHKRPFGGEDLYMPSVLGAGAASDGAQMPLGTAQEQGVARGSGMAVNMADAGSMDRAGSAFKARMESGQGPANAAFGGGGPLGGGFGGLSGSQALTGAQGLNSSGDPLGDAQRAAAQPGPDFSMPAGPNVSAVPSSGPPAPTAVPTSQVPGTPAPRQAPRTGATSSAPDSAADAAADRALPLNEWVDAHADEAIDAAQAPPPAPAPEKPSLRQARYGDSDKGGDA